MEKAATKEFIIGLSNVEGSRKFSPQVATVNGVKGRIWTKRILLDNNWVNQGQQFVRNGAYEVEIDASFDSVDE